MTSITLKDGKVVNISDANDLADVLRNEGQQQIAEVLEMFIQEVDALVIHTRDTLDLVSAAISGDLDVDTDNKLHMVQLGLRDYEKDVRSF